MTMEVDLSGRLEEAQESLAELIDRLQAHAALAESLANARGLLVQAAADTSELVKSASATQDSLAETLAATRNLLEVLSRVDTAPVLMSIESAQQSVVAALDQSTGNIANTTQAQIDVLREVVSSAGQSVERRLDTMHLRLSEQHARDAKSLKVLGALTLIVATAAAVGSIIAVVSTIG